MLKALLVAYFLGGITFIPCVLLALVFIVIYTSPPVGDADPTKGTKAKLVQSTDTNDPTNPEDPSTTTSVPDNSKSVQGWVTVRRTFEETPVEGSYVNQMVRSFLDARSRSKDTKRTRPKDTFFAVLKGRVLFLYEDEAMTDCWAAIELSSYDVSIYPSGGLDGELFAKRNAIMLRVRTPEEGDAGIVPSLTKDMKLGGDDDDDSNNEATPFDHHSSGDLEKKGNDDVPNASQGDENNNISNNINDPSARDDTAAAAAREDVFDQTRPWFIFVKSNTRMEDWYLALVQTSVNPPGTQPLQNLLPIFSASDMDVLVTTLDNQPDPIPMRWLNALVGRVFFSVYKTARIEEFIIGRIKRKISKVKRPSFLTDIVVREASVGSTAPMLSRPMLKELTKEGVASVELGVHYKGEVRITIEATASINLGSRFKSYTVKLVLAVVVKEIQGNMLLRVKSPPSNRVWYAFTTMPKLELEVQPVVSDRQIKWGMVLKPIESLLRDVIQESVVLPNMDDIPFFDTSPYAIRGGIFPDAVRKERDSDLDASEKTEKPNTDGPSLKRSVSAEHLELSEKPLSGAGDSGSLQAGIFRSETTTSLPIISFTSDNKPLVEPVASPAANKRSSWFGSSKSNTSKGDNALAFGRQEPLSEGEEQHDPLPRGPRSPLSSEGPAVDTGTPTSPRAQRSRSPAADEHAPIVQEVTSSVTDTIHVEPINPDSSPSQHEFPTSPTSPSTPRTVPRLRSPSLFSHRATSSVDSTGSFQMSRSDTEDPKPSTSSSTVTQSATASAASTLLATWKSRTADKQALSATARETMKKWGWGSGRKSTAESSVPGPDPVIKEEPVRSKSPNGAAKQTYAEMRAHVEERRQAEQREKERQAQAQGRGLGPAFEPSPPRSRSPEQLSAPVDIPGDHSRQRTLSAAHSVGRRSSAASSISGFTGGVSPPTSPKLKATVGGTQVSGSPPLARFISPSTPRTTTEVAAQSPPAIRSPSPTTAPLSPPPPLKADPTPRERVLSRPKAPIHAQPSSAPTMMIPQIHASHRGEIMALGSAPPPPPATNGQSDTPPSTQPKLASIQRVYQLFNKSGNQGSSSSLTSGKPSSSSGSTHSASAREREEESDALSESGSTKQKTKPEPPALPPRPRTQSALPSTDDVPPVESKASPESSSPASGALEQVIATAQGSSQTEDLSILPVEREEKAKGEAPAVPIPSGPDPPKVEGEDIHAPDEVTRHIQAPIEKPPLPPR